jgi:hypothetical protein
MEVGKHSPCPLAVGHTLAALLGHAIFAHEMQTALRLTVGFSNIIVNYNKFVTYELQICQVLNYT